MTLFKTTMSGIFGLLTFVFVVAIAPIHSAHASKVYGGFGLGVSKGTFKQSYSGQSTSLTADPSFTLEGVFGIKLGPLVQIEYTPMFTSAYFGTRYVGSNAEPNDFSYQQWLAFNVAFQIPYVGLRPYVGAGINNIGFAFGTTSGFSGPFYRVGVTYDIDGAVPTFRAKAEYQHHSFDSDGSGGIPTGASVSGELWLLALDFVFGAHSKQEATP